MADSSTASRQEDIDVGRIVGAVVRELRVLNDKLGDSVESGDNPVVMKVYSAEFKAEAVAMYLSDPDRTMASVTLALGISRETLRLWVRQARAAGTATEKARPSSKLPEPPFTPATRDPVLSEVTVAVASSLASVRLPV
jgi:transposase